MRRVGFGACLCVGLGLAGVALGQGVGTVAERVQRAGDGGRVAVMPAPVRGVNGAGNGPPTFDDARGPMVLGLGRLLMPVEEAVVYRRPELVFVYRAQKVRVFAAIDGKEVTDKAKPILLPLAGASGVLLGVCDGVAVFAQNRAVAGVDLKTMAVVWTQALAPSARDERLPAAGREEVDVAGDPELRRQAAIKGLNKPAFSTVKLVGDSVYVTSGGELRGYRIKTGEAVWKDATGNEVRQVLPEKGWAGAIVGDGERVVVEVTAEKETRFVGAEVKTGKAVREVTEKERVLWRGMAGQKLVVVTAKGVTAYRLDAAGEQVAWRREDAVVGHAGATRVVGDQVVVVKADGEVVGLSVKTGATVWARQRLGSEGKGPGVDGRTVVRSEVAGARVYFLWERGMAAFEGLRKEQQRVWEMDFAEGTAPPLERMEVTDLYVVAIAAGAMQSAQRAVHLLIGNVEGGQRMLDKPIKRSTSVSDLEGPIVREWGAVDNGVVLEVNGTVYFYHGAILEE